MNRRTILTHIVGAVAVAAVAQTNTPLAEGYLDRGVAMYADANYVGCTDQLSHYLSLSPMPSHTETARYYLAMSALRQADPQALVMLEAFLADYPVSCHRTAVELAIADYFYDMEEYAAALARYNAIDPQALNPVDAAECLYRKAYCLLMTADYSDAATIYGDLAAQKPRRFFAKGEPSYANDASFYLGYIDYAKGEYAAARQKFESVEQGGNPTDLTDYYLAQIYYADGDYKKALQMAERLLKKQVADGYIAEMHRVAGESLYRLGRERDAIRQLQDYAGMTDAPQPSALYILGLSQYRAADYAGAVKSLSPVTAQENAMGQSAYLLIGQSLLHQNNYDAAMMAFEKAQRLSFSPEMRETAYYNYAVASMKGGRIPFGSTVATFEDFLKRYPDSQYAPEIQEYVVSGYITDNNYQAALESINRITSPTDKTLKAKQMVLYTLGVRELQSGQAAAALEHLRQSRALARYDESLATETDLWIGEALYKQGKYAEAVRAYEQYLARAPKTAANRAMARYDLGYAYFGERRFAEARQAFEALLKQPGELSKSTLADAQNRIADCLYYASDFKGAAAAYDRAYALQPGAGDYPLYQKALMKGLARDYQGKISDLTAMVERFPTSALVPSALLEMGESYTDLGHADKAIETFSLLGLKYPSTPQGRQGHLLLAITYLNAGNRQQAITTYKKVISTFPTSEEARAAADDLKHIYADAGELDQYLSFVQSVPNAPQLEPSEVDQLSYSSAEKAYADRGETRLLREYVEKFPQGSSRPEALAMLAEGAQKEGRTEEAYAYATQLVETYPDAAAALRVLPLKAAIEVATGRHELAMASYTQMEERASTASEQAAARMGALRTAQLLGLNEQVIATADKLLGQSTPLQADKAEVAYARAEALAKTGSEAEACEAWAELAKTPADIYGTRAAFALAQHYFDTDRTAEADRAVNELLDANPPHDYWVARAFILLSDIRRRQGDEFEANEYLRSLRENYPGTEADIFELIDQRLKGC